MFTVEIRVNGSIIMAVSAANQTPHGDLCTYAYQAAYFGFGEGPPARPSGMTKGTVQHRRSHGIERLVRKILQAVEHETEEKEYDEKKDG